MNLSTLLAISTLILAESITDDTRYPTFMPTHNDATLSPTFAVSAPIFIPTPEPNLENELPHSKPSYGGYSMNYYDILDKFSGKSSKVTSGKSSKQGSGKSAKRSSKSSKSRSKIDAKSDTETDVKVSGNSGTDSSGKSRKEVLKSSKSSISSSKTSGKSGKASSGKSKKEDVADAKFSDSIDQSNKASGKSGKSGNDTGTVNGGYGDYPPSYSYAVPTTLPVAFLITPPPIGLSTCSSKLLERCCRNPSSNSAPLQNRCERKGCVCTK